MTSAKFRLEAARRQGLSKPNLKGRAQALGAEEGRRLKAAAFALSGMSKKDLLDMLGVHIPKGTCLQLRLDATGVDSFCAVDRPGRMRDNVAAAARAMLRPCEPQVAVAIVLDETYLSKRYDAVNLYGSTVVVGRAWPRAMQTEAELEGEDGDAFAALMLDIMIKRADCHGTISVCALPLEAPALPTDACSHLGKALVSALECADIGAICVAYDNGSNFMAIDAALRGRPMQPSMAADAFWGACEIITAPHGAWETRVLAARRPRDGQLSILWASKCFERPGPHDEVLRGSLADHRPHPHDRRRARGCWHQHRARRLGEGRQRHMRHEPPVGCGCSRVAGRLLPAALGRVVVQRLRLHGGILHCDFGSGALVGPAHVPCHALPVRRLLVLLAITRCIVPGRTTGSFAAAGSVLPRPSSRRGRSSTSPGCAST